MTSEIKKKTRHLLSANSYVISFWLFLWPHLRHLSISTLVTMTSLLFPGNSSHSPASGPSFVGTFAWSDLLGFQWLPLFLTTLFTAPPCYKHIQCFVCILHAMFTSWTQIIFVHMSPDHYQSHINMQMPFILSPCLDYLSPGSGRVLGHVIL